MVVGPGVHMCRECGALAVAAADVYDALVQAAQRASDGHVVR